MKEWRSRSNNSGTKKQIPEESKCDIGTKPEVIILGDDKSLANISSKTYIKGNVSSKTNVEGNVSSETYTVNGNLSCDTYVKDNSNSVNILPYSSKNIMLTPLRGKSPLFEESCSDRNSVLLSPIVKDASVLRQANVSGENIRSIIKTHLWCGDKNKCLNLINEGERNSVQANNLTKSLKRKSTSVFNVSSPKKLVLDGSKRTPDHFPNLKWNRSKPVQVKQYVRSIEYLDPIMTAKGAALFLQTRFRARNVMKTEMKKDVAEFHQLQCATIMLQRRFRAIRVMKAELVKFQQLKKTVVAIQRRFRTNQLIRKCTIEFQQARNAIISLQRRFRANKARRRFRTNRAMYMERLRFVKLKKAVLVFQTQFRRLKETENDRKEFLEILRRAVATLKIQRYHFCKQYPQIKKIRENVEELTSKAVPYDTLGNRRQRALQKLISIAPTLWQIIHALEDLEFITRRYRDTCVKMNNLLSEQLYITISLTNRSPSEMQACTVATSILSISVNIHQHNHQLGFLNTWITLLQ
ncbi:hypothetical protein ILUMI_20867 [Ignelater luminosus]|uniref:Abnormal spindle-like microcephaly-associated protein n=1 Tax=Ignelater luminosus TaxID=2038154 RepID=A0A8K0G458_IGNLU|nr:hypothetical protein ILUMI_20867 [Ignelater luminosus]